MVQAVEVGACWATTPKAHAHMVFIKPTEKVRLQLCSRKLLLQGCTKQSPIKL